jgi:hypothetical protein
LVLTIVIKVTVGKVKSVQEEAYVYIFEQRDKFGVLYYKNFLDKGCGIQKNCWLDDDCSLEDFGLCMHNGF